MSQRIDNSCLPYWPNPVRHGPKRRSHFEKNGSGFCIVIFENTAQIQITVYVGHICHGPLLVEST